MHAYRNAQVPLTALRLFLPNAVIYFDALLLRVFVSIDFIGTMFSITAMDRTDFLLLAYSRAPR